MQTLRFDRGGISVHSLEAAHPSPADRRDPLLDPKIHGNKQFAFQVEDFDRFLNVMDEKGTDIVIVSPDGSASYKAFYLRDCGANPLKFIEPQTPEKPR
jgi:hypothetical protein